MSDEKDTAASPDAMSDEDRQKLEELKQQEAEEAKAKAEEEAEAAADAADEARWERENRELDYVLVRHMARSPRTRLMRHARAGHRRQGVILDDGTCIKKRGRLRYTQIGLGTVLKGHGRLLEYVRVGTLEVLNPVDESVIPYEELCALIEYLGRDVEGFELREESIVPQDEVLGADSSLNSAPSDRDYEDEDDYEGKDDLDPENDQSDIPPPGEDATNPDLGQGALIAAVDQSNAGMTGEANPPPSEKESSEEMVSQADFDAGNTQVDPPPSEGEDKGSADTTLDPTPPPDEGEEKTEGEPEWDEERLLALNRVQLNDLAEKYKIEAPDKLPNKPAVVNAIMDALTAGGE